jgi:hypothetical protein
VANRATAKHGNQTGALTGTAAFAQMQPVARADCRHLAARRKPGSAAVPVAARGGYPLSFAGKDFAVQPARHRPRGAWSAFTHPSQPFPP